MFKGESIDSVLKQPATRIFALLKQGRQLERQRMASTYSELCDIVMCSAQPKEYKTGLQGVYNRRFSNKSEELPSERMKKVALGVLAGFKIGEGSNGR